MGRPCLPAMGYFRSASAGARSSAFKSSIKIFRRVAIPPLVASVHLASQKSPLFSSRKKAGFRSTSVSASAYLAAPRWHQRGHLHRTTPKGSVKYFCSVHRSLVLTLPEKSIGLEVGAKAGNFCLTPKASGSGERSVSHLELSSFPPVKLATLL